MPAEGAAHAPGAGAPRCFSETGRGPPPLAGVRLQREPEEGLGKPDSALLRGAPFPSEAEMQFMGSRADAEACHREVGGQQSPSLAVPRKTLHRFWGAKRLGLLSLGCVGRCPPRAMGGYYETLNAAPQRSPLPTSPPFLSLPAPKGSLCHLPRCTAQRLQSDLESGLYPL